MVKFKETQKYNLVFALFLIQMSHIKVISKSFILDICENIKQMKLKKRLKQNKAIFSYLIKNHRHYHLDP